MKDAQQLPTAAAQRTLQTINLDKTRQRNEFLMNHPKVEYSKMLFKSICVALQNS